MLQTAIDYGEAYIQINGKPQEGGLGGGKWKREEVRLRSQKSGECEERGQVKEEKRRAWEREGERARGDREESRKEGGKRV